jgi:hypothetical protein
MPSDALENPPLAEWIVKESDDDPNFRVSVVIIRTGERYVAVAA